jgi:hypothetical protein
MEVTSRPGPFTLRKYPGNHWIGGWVVYGAGLDFSETKKSISAAGIQIPDLPTRDLVTIRTTYEILSWW